MRFDTIKKLESLSTYFKLTNSRKLKNEYQINTK